MTIEWRYTVEQELGILSISGYLGPDAVHRFAGAIGWVVQRGSGPVIVDLSALRGWSAEGQSAITEAARRLATAGRGLELAAIPADGSLVPDADCPPIPVHADLAGALAAHRTRNGEPPEGRHEWRTTGWPTGDDPGA
ncbi:STAS domain-containing protein [Streptomyces sp. MBT62]|uniref:STAS domain-containing protein n=1 Tax=Streptomyces sp. MBT62 TaxID=2800410 RepID=UPI00190A368F|nr:STAS domain-containing protein [Streptomyces sp. MBT62]MBK3566712.1 STAS domain-containing protein [Streptomyces sp. MBT62]